MTQPRAYVVVGDNPPYKSKSLGPYRKTEVPEMVLICFDTLAVAKINKRKDFRDLPEELKLYCPAKYALTTSKGGEDVKIFCQVHAQSPEYREKAVWFDCFKDLPRAIETFRSRNLKIKISSGISSVLDWPISDEKFIKGSIVEFL